MATTLRVAAGDTKLSSHSKKKRETQLSCKSCCFFSSFFFFNYYNTPRLFTSITHFGRQNNTLTTLDFVVFANYTAWFIAMAKQ